MVPQAAHTQNPPSLRAAKEADKPASNIKGSASIENELVRIELNSESGDITGLYNKRTGKEFIAAKEWARAFRLNVPFPRRVTGYLVDYSANSLDSWRQTQCNITRASDAEGKVIKVQYPPLESEAGKFQIEVNYSIRLPNNSDEAILQLELTNHSPYRVKEVFFPWVSGVRAIEGEPADTFVAPDIIRSVADLRKDHEGGGNWEEYPYLLNVPMWPNGYGLSMPWMNYGGKREGLYLASLCRDGIYHMFMIQNFGDARHPILAFAWAIPSYIAPGKSWRTPEIRLSLHSGDWHVAADKYCASLEGWYQKPDTPPEFKKALASFNSLFTTRDFVEIADLAEDIRKYGLQHLVMWNFGDCYPKVTEQDDLSVDPPRLGLFTPQWGGLAKLKAAMRESNPGAILMGEGSEVVASQILDAGWVWGTPSNPEVFRYTLPWAVVAAAVNVDAAQANKSFVLGLHLAIIAKGLENGKKLSDFPEFAQHVARLASFRERTERFWVEGTFQDDIGLRVTGAFGKVYKTREEIAIMLANLTNEAVDASFELDTRQYGIASASYSMISSRGRSEGGRAAEEGTLLKGTQSFAPYEVVAVVFKR